MAAIRKPFLHRCVGVSMCQRFFHAKIYLKYRNFTKKICQRIDTLTQVSIYLLELLAEGTAFAIVIWLA